MSRRSATTLKQGSCCREKKTNYVFSAIRRKSYGCEVSPFVENRRMPSLTGVKSEGLLIWVTVSDICVMEVGKITFAMPPGLLRK
ncbi:hypothetical protein Hdeb2414_s0007g00252381 [Helianthus debilis subsp. tardiflorus]